MQKSRANELVVYNINKKSLVSFRTGGRLFFVDVDTSKEKFAEKYNFFVKGYISAVGAVTSYEVVNPILKRSTSGNDSFAKAINRMGVTLISFNDKIMAIPYDKNLDRMVVNHQMVVDFLVINRYSPYKVLDFFNPKVVIIDSSVSKQTIKNVTLACSQKHLPFYITSSQGAYVKTF